MRKGRLLIALVSLVGVNEVLGQWVGTTTPITTIANVGIGMSTSTTPSTPSAKLHVVTTGTTPAALFMGGNVGIGTTTPTLAQLQVVSSAATKPSAIFSIGKVGIGGLSTSFAGTTLPTELLHVKDGNARIQNGTLQINYPGFTGEALMVENGISRLGGGLYVGTQQQGGGFSLEYNSNGILDINSRTNGITYDFNMSNMLNNVDMLGPVLSTKGNMIFRNNSDVYNGQPYNFKFLSGNTELANLSNTGKLSINPSSDHQVALEASSQGLIKAGLTNIMGDQNGMIGFNWGYYRATPTATVADQTIEANKFASRFIFWTASGDLQYQVTTSPPSSSANTPITSTITPITIKNTGRVDIGGKIYTPSVADVTVKLAVAGTLVAQKLKCTAATNWPDYVFANDYTLQPLAEVEQYVQANKRLPNIPTACELEENGIDTGEMLRLQMIKIEELTLHLIEQQKEMFEMKKQLVQLLKK